MSKVYIPKNIGEKTKAYFQEMPEGEWLTKKTLPSGLGRFSKIAWLVCFGLVERKIVDPTGRQKTKQELWRRRTQKEIIDHFMNSQQCEVNL